MVNTYIHCIKGQLQQPEISTVLLKPAAVLAAEGLTLYMYSRKKSNNSIIFLKHIFSRLYLTWNSFIHKCNHHSELPEKYSGKLHHLEDGF